MLQNMFVCIWLINKMLTAICADGQKHEVKKKLKRIAGFSRISPTFEGLLKNNKEFV